MPFMLEVEFSGLCQYLIHPDGRQVGIVMPDARVPADGRPVDPYDFSTCHEHLVYHVGYIRYDLADTGVDVPSAGRGGTPSFEVVRRFDFDDLDFGLGFDEPMQLVHLNMPDVPKFAPMVTPKPGLYSEKPPCGLLMRTVLRGGSLTSVPNGGYWKFNQVLQPRQKAYQDSFAGSSLWRRFVFEDEIAIRLGTWDGVEKSVIRLRPHGRDRVVKLKIANLCAENPLEWPEVFLRRFNAKADVDFKWFYFLWNDSRGGFPDLLKLKPPYLLPVPEPVDGHGDVTNCTGPQHTLDFLGA